jgi:ribose transport system substrate-binding protein
MANDANPGTKNLARAVFWPVFVIAVVAFGLYATQQYGGTRPSVVFITADSTPYWERVIDGANDAAEQYGISLQVIRASGTMDDQGDRLDSAAAAGADAVVISPVDGLRQTAALREVARASVLVTVDSDSELSDRVCFVGMDNYVAGIEAAAMVRRALPNGGRVLIAAGPLDKTNGQERRQGVIDALMGRDERSELNADPLETPIAGDGFTIVRTLVDNLDEDQASSQITEILTGGEDVDAIVGLYAYHAVAAARAVADSGKDIVVVGFDALPESLDAVENGTVFGLIAQDQFGYGYHSVRMAAEAVEGYDNAPISGMLALPPMRVTLSSLDRVREDLGLKKP